MKKTIILFLFITSFILFSCEQPLENETVLQINEISAVPQVIAQGETSQLSCGLEITGKTSKHNITYEWTSSKGSINDRDAQSTFWTAPNAIGNYTIDLAVSYDGNTVYGNVAIKVVKTPADNWGSISGYLYDEDGKKLKNVTVSTITGESSKTDKDGYFYISDIPQGENSIQFSGIDYKWAADIPGGVNIIGGSHVHLQNIIIYHSIAPVFTNSVSLPGKRLLLKWEPVDPTLYRFVDLYRATKKTSSKTKVKRFDSFQNSIVMAHSTKEGFYWFLKAIPFYGDISDFSSPKWGYYGSIQDPDASQSYFTYSDFFHSSLHWQSIDFEKYLNGYKIAKLNGNYWEFISDLLPTSEHKYDLITSPGQTGIYYVISIADDGDYNHTQYSNDRISLTVPALAEPLNSHGNYNSSLNRIELSWDPIAINPTWHTGYIIEKAIGENPGYGDWSILADFFSIYITNYNDTNISSGNIYNYRIRSTAVSPINANTYKSSYKEFSINVP